MSCTKKVRIECDCGGSGIKRQWSNKGECFINVTCDCGGSGYIYQKQENHDWKYVECSNMAYYVCKKCGIHSNTPT